MATSTSARMTTGAMLQTAILAVVASPLGLILSAAISVFVLTSLVGRVIRAEFDQGFPTKTPRLIKVRPAIKTVCDFSIASGAGIGILGGVLTANIVGWPSVLAILLGLNSFLVFSVAVENQYQILSNQTALKWTRRTLLVAYYLTILALAPLGGFLAIVTTVAYFVGLVLAAMGIKIYLPPLPARNHLAWDRFWLAGCDTYRNLLLIWIPVGIVVFLVAALRLHHTLIAVSSLVTVVLSALIFLAIGTNEERASWN